VRSVRQPPAAVWADAPVISAFDRQIATPTDYILVLGAEAQACELGTRAASAPGRQPPVRRRGRGASPGAGRGHRPPNPAAQGPSWIPRTTSSPAQLLTGPRGRTAANIAASGPSDRAAGLPSPRTPWPCPATGVLLVEVVWLYLPSPTSVASRMASTFP
jgi:hypothetical protein